jgi:hypothetical protein
VDVGQVVDPEINEPVSAVDAVAASRELVDLDSGLGGALADNFALFLFHWIEQP